MDKAIGRLRRLPEITCLFPKTLAEALSVLRKHNGKARPFAGGTDLLNKMKRREVVPRLLVDLKRVPDLKFIKYDKKSGLRIGAATTLAEILESRTARKHCPILVEAVSQMASPQIRNTGTIGGNLCNAVPSADTAPPLIAAGAHLKLVGLNRKVRTVSAEDFFKGPNKTVLGPVELLSEIQIPPAPSHSSGTYLKHTLRREMDLAIVGVATHVTVDSKKDACKDVRIVLGAVAPRPMRAKNAEDALRGKIISDELIETAAEIASKESKPIDDIRSSAEYRKEMVRVLTKRALRKCLGK